MEKISINEFIDKSNIEIVKSLLKVNNGYITSRIITELGIHRMYLNILCKKGVIKKVGNGIYIESNKKIDKYYVFCLELPKIVYSHITGLYLHGFKVKIIDKFDITVPNNYFNYKIKEQNVFYVSNKIYKLGITDVKTDMGNSVKVYDIERCICDVIRSKNRVDSNQIKSIFKEYFNRKDKDINKLLKYAEVLNIKNEINKYMEEYYGKNNSK